MSLRASVAPDPDAEWLASRMVEMDGVMRQILSETIPGEEGVEVHESGRTLCGSGTEVKGPLARFPSSVELASCPASVRGGTWHTHVTKEELRDPHNSLPDTANVIFGNIDVSAVVGTRSVETVVAPANREHAITVFQDAIGTEVTSTEGVVDAILDNRVTDPTDARKRVRRRMGPLFTRHRAKFRDLDGRLDTSGIPASSPVSVEFHEARLYAHYAEESVTHKRHSKNPVRDPAGLRNLSRDGAQSVKRTVTETDVTDIAKSTVVSEAVRAAISPLLP